MSQTLKQLSSSQGDTEQVAVFIGAASHSELLQQLDTWVARGWLRAKRKPQGIKNAKS